MYGYIWVYRVSGLGLGVCQPPGAVFSLGFVLERLSESVLIDRFSPCALPLVRSYMMYDFQIQVSERTACGDWHGVQGECHQPDYPHRRDPEGG